MGTTKSERDICDTCWGTGDADRHGLDLRKLKADEDVRVAERAAELLARAVGASLDNCRPAIAYLIGVIDKVSNKRGAPAAPYLPELAQALANTLRRAIGATEVRKWR
jgi:HEAT repeat protein